MNFNTFSTLYGATIATSSFSGSGYTSSLVQAAQDLDFTITIISGSSLGDELQITSSFGSLISHSLTTSSFNERTSSVALGDATPFQSILVQGTLTASNAVSASGNIFGSQLYAQGGSVFTANTSSLRNVSNGLSVGVHPLFQSVTLGKAGVNMNLNGVLASDLTASAAAAISGANAIHGDRIIAGTRVETPRVSGGSNQLNVGDIQGIYLEGPVTASTHISSSGDINSNKLTVVNTVIFSNLPTEDPSVPGQLYRDGEGNVKISL